MQSIQFSPVTYYKPVYPLSQPKIGNTRAISFGAAEDPPKLENRNKKLGLLMGRLSQLLKVPRTKEGVGKMALILSGLSFLGSVAYNSYTNRSYQATLEKMENTKNKMWGLDPDPTAMLRSRYQEIEKALTTALESLDKPYDLEKLKKAARDSGGQKPDGSQFNIGDCKEATALYNLLHFLALTHNAVHEYATQSNCLNLTGTIKQFPTFGASLDEETLIAADKLLEKAKEKKDLREVEPLFNEWLDGYVLKHSNPTRAMLIRNTVKLFFNDAHDNFAEMQSKLTTYKNHVAKTESVFENSQYNQGVAKQIMVFTAIIAVLSLVYVTKTMQKPPAKA